MSSSRGDLTPRLLDREATAAYLGGGATRTIDALVAAGHIKPVRLPSTRREGEQGRRVFFDRHDLDALIDKWKAE